MRARTEPFFGTEFWEAVILVVPAALLLGAAIALT